MKQIRNGEAVIEAQLNAGYESSSDFQDAFSKIMSANLNQTNQQLTTLKASWLDTPLGSMFAIANDEALYLLEFVERRGLEREVERLQQRTKSAIIPGITKPITSIENEIKAYFDGELTEFKTPYHLQGSPFQKRVWEALCKIPYGITKSYKEQAETIDMPLACRAVANANGANQLAIIIPCHRIITSSGDLGGYGGGIARKKWLIEHERTMARINLEPFRDC